MVFQITQERETVIDQVKAVYVWEDNGDYSTGYKKYFSERKYNCELCDLPNYLSRIGYCLQSTTTRSIVGLQTSLPCGMRPTAQSSINGRNTEARVRHQFSKLGFMVLNSGYKYGPQCYDDGPYKWDMIVIEDPNMELYSRLLGGYRGPVHECKMNNRIRVPKVLKSRGVPILNIPISISDDGVFINNEPILNRLLLVEAKGQAKSGTAQNKAVYAMHSVYRINGDCLMDQL